MGGSLASGKLGGRASMPHLLAVTAVGQTQEELPGRVGGIQSHRLGIGQALTIPVAWALDKLSPYLLHRKFFLYCDNRPLVDLNTFLKSSHKRTLKHCEHFLENFYPIWHTSLSPRMSSQTKAGCSRPR